MQTKVLHIGKYYPPFMGGIENFMQLLMEEQVLSKKDNKNYIIKAIVHQHLSSTLTERVPLQKEIIGNIEIIRVPSYGRVLFAPVSPSFPYYLQQIIKSFQPDILHIHMPNTSAFWLLFNTLAKKIPWVIHWHSDVLASEHDKLLSIAYPFYKPFETAMLKRAKAIIATSPDYLDSSLALKQWKNKAHVIPLALNSSKQVSNTLFSKKDLIQLWGNSSTRLLCIGRLTYYKGYQDIIRSMKLIPDAKLIIVGHGEQQSQLEKLIKQQHLTDSIFLAGKVDNSTLNNLLQSCDIFCLSSIERTEAFGLVLLEAMSYSKPIVITRVPGSGMNWVTQNNLTALFADKQNPEDLADKINSLINNKTLAKTLGDNGFQRLLKYFNIKTISQQTEQLYYSILHAH
jgi:glycosyltransferase involved in cell wall biosynthesis